MTGDLQKIDLETVLVRDSSLVSAPLDEELVMMSLENGRYYGLNSPAARIWELLEQPVSVQSICDRLVTEYTVNMELCREDVLDLLRLLAAEKLVRSADPEFP